MPRPERPLNPGTNPLHAFASDLRALREEAGNPKFLQMARRTGKSRTALSEASGGDHLPTWETVQAYVTACGGDPDAWRVRWERVRDALRDPGDGPSERTPGSAPSQAAGPRANAGPRRVLPAVTGAVAVAAATTAAVLLVGDDGPGSPLPAVSSGRDGGPVVVEVQNKIALGSSGLVEDSTPVYLSTRTLARCARRGCKLDGTEMWSGAVLRARCRATGAVLHNFNLEDPAALDNPEHVRSSLWYRVEMPDKRTGWLSEVYVVRAHRDGLGLPVCSGVDTDGVTTDGA